MTVGELRRINQSENNKTKVSANVLKQIAEELRFSAEINPLFINEVNIYVHSLHKIVSKTDYYDEVESDIEEVCTLALHLSQNLKVIEKTGKKTIPKSLIAEMKRMGKLLSDMAPFIRSIAALMILMNSSDIQFFG